MIRDLINQRFFYATDGNKEMVEKLDAEIDAAIRAMNEAKK